jgi:hypothetical protein
MRVSPTTWRNALRSAWRGGRCRGRDLVERECCVRPHVAGPRHLDGQNPVRALSALSLPRARATMAAAVAARPEPRQFGRRASSGAATTIASRSRPRGHVVVPPRHRVGGTASAREGAVAHGYSEQQHRQIGKHDDARGHAAGDPVSQNRPSRPVRSRTVPPEPVCHRGLLPRRTASGCPDPSAAGEEFEQQRAAAGDEHRAARHCGHPGRGPH